MLRLGTALKGWVEAGSWRAPRTDDLTQCLPQNRKICPAPQHGRWGTDMTPSPLILYSFHLFFYLNFYMEINDPKTLWLCEVVSETVEPLAHGSLDKSRQLGVAPRT